MTLSHALATHAPLAEVTPLLDALDRYERFVALEQLNRDEQRQLFAIADPAIEESDLVPEGTAAHTEVVHRGRNTLPVLRNFEKRFARGNGKIYGYNEGSTRTFIGPGYFVAKPTPVDVAHRGALVVDYFEVPRGPTPSGWPRIRPNWFGPQALVFHHTRDYLRKVTDGVLIGSAYKTILGKELALDSYFILYRPV